MNGIIYSVEGDTRNFDRYWEAIACAKGIVNAGGPELVCVSKMDQTAPCVDWFWEPCATVVMGREGHAILRR